MAEFNVVCFNPTREKLTELLGTEPEKDPEYLGEKDGNITLRLSIWLREVKSGTLFNGTIFLEDREMQSKEREDDPTYVQKFQFINKRGRTVYAASEKELSETFKKYEYHKARVGEAELASFLDAWLDLDRREDYSVIPDWKLLMKGSMKELEGLQNSDLPRTVATPATVRIVEKPGEERKEYQSIYTKRWLPGWAMKFFRINSFTPDKIEALRTKADEIKAKNKAITDPKKKTYLKDWEYYILEAADSQYGIKDVYTLEELKDYVPEEHMTGSDAVSTHSETDADY